MVCNFGLKDDLKITQKILFLSHCERSELRLLSVWILAPKIKIRIWRHNFGPFWGENSNETILMSLNFFFKIEIMRSSGWKMVEKPLFVNFYDWFIVRHPFNQRDFTSLYTMMLWLPEARNHYFTIEQLYLQSAKKLGNGRFNFENCQNPSKSALHLLFILNHNLWKCHIWIFPPKIIFCCINFHAKNGLFAPYL